MFFFVQVLLLFFFSRLLTQSISQALFKLTKNKKLTVSILALIFFPGVVVHELAHFFMATIFMVKTGEIEFLPVLQGDGVKLGSVAIAKTDLIRRFFIGVAPVILGLLIILSSFYFLTTDSSIVQTIEPNKTLKTIYIILTFYVLFVISNTMFSSKKDMEGALELFLIIGLVMLILYILGVRIPSISPNSMLTPQIMDIIKKSDVLLLIPIIIDVFIIGVIKLTEKFI